ncbi:MULTISPECIES: phosphorylase [Spirulina sp. CCY15215]|uniref:ATP adenylyltransferase family protein n=1 Tax=Spirulina sp. CCY15215 TaxID=2767591 RepID=UPI001950B779|nr:phosphorylase [Spirulina major]
MTRGQANTQKLLLEPGTLWQKTTERTQSAIASGALQSIPTEYEFIEQAGINFLVRISLNLRRKEKDRQQKENKTKATGKVFNPFLPYESELFVTDISPTHLCLFNKFNVVDRHLLLVTREFEHQETWLTLEDFTAMWACLTEIDGLAFYNGGEKAGASQMHKHLQIVPFPLIPAGENMPISPLISTVKWQEKIGKIDSFSFNHAIIRFDFKDNLSIWDKAQRTLNLYQDLLNKIGIFHNGEERGQQTHAYNLLATREWLLIVARSQGEFQSIGVNSLGFAGTFFVRDTEQLNLLKKLTPLKILKNVSF